ncbi:helix-turn-helix domain-containing protein [Pseudidiomarina taiwanensis]|uniref:HTH cro/C1-type domain-containing protein n=1 Tax=Pseudidiomarina taiwanensis TaxID=337250 RepID=A0A432ZJY0_9GAMM|nr:helix-turn-helix transcriptional regulator [Pseudidiomarina taiwanensis]RUO78223.1 hypothetical protein CWI83_04085 [Pseudidiomarina taiwanensis]
MDNQKIKKELAKKGFDYSMIAQVLGKSPSLVSKVANRKARSKAVAEALAKALGCSLDEVFPDVESYHQQGSSSQTKKQKQRELVALLKGQAKDD